MMQTLALSDIWTKFKNALVTDNDLEAFCLNTFGKEPLIFIGKTSNDPPVADDCPYILLQPGSKIEGENFHYYRYLIPVKWAVNNSTIQTTNNLIEEMGLYQADDMGQYILNALSGSIPNATISRVQYSIEPKENFPQITGQMELKISIPATIGSNPTI